MPLAIMQRALAAIKISCLFIARRQQRALRGLAAARRVFEARAASSQKGVKICRRHKGSGLALSDSATPAPCTMPGSSSRRTLLGRSAAVSRVPGSTVCRVGLRPGRSWSSATPVQPGQCGMRWMPWVAMAVRRDRRCGTWPGCSCRSVIGLCAMAGTASVSTGMKPKASWSRHLGCWLGTTAMNAQVGMAVTGQTPAKRQQREWGFGGN